jgi:hypothetical protein
MLNIFYSILVLAATTVVCYYAFFLQPTEEDAQYQYAYAGIALTAAVIFAALWLAGLIHRSRDKASSIID